MTDRGADKHINRQTDKWINNQANKQTYRQTNRQTDKQTDRNNWLSYKGSLSEQQYRREIVQQRYMRQSQYSHNTEAKSIDIRFSLWR